MTNQEQREKAIKGLEHCVNKSGGCYDCPYTDCDSCTPFCKAQVMRDALALLKAQEPRVMTYDEVKVHYNLPSCFIDDLDAKEDYYKDIQPLYFDFPNPTCWDVHWRNSEHVRTYLDEWADRYNKTWRCWTSRPTDEQREAVKWE